MVNMQRTYLAFQHNCRLSTLRATVTASLFKQAKDDDHVVITDSTIFHPQGGGQPSDVGAMTIELGARFDVHMVRMSAVAQGEVLHFGRFADASSVFQPGETVTQSIDAEKRLLYSRYHTAGHSEGFDETKASHFPDSASCEFQGLIDSKWKDLIQQRVDEYIEKDMAKFRVVKIVGAETYPCGGTHVQSTRQCGKTMLKKISRAKGMSKVGYFLA
ncbi:hypothetical protein C8A03DRAFT_47686 [Achaetomium macrosporum]|uniref:Threonyl/alanyl tRNA synthetase SAD domain-containing protein n=1 Tax=Achaetomium macrosporum TaxID=79813 RepID=A0AAN7C228_9PEZI|nr:hypothetical protein C8A03DRAFT_47686 [Achaetomium macrosporum]